MDLEKAKSIKFLLNGLRRPHTENFPAASVAEAIDLLIEACEFLLDSIQPERLNDSTLTGCESLNSMETQREKPEEIFPPRNRS